MNKLSLAIQKHWQTPNFLLTIFFLPLSYLFGGIVSLRRFLFKAKILSSKKLPVPVVIIGNINVGGVGKTPILIHLCQSLKEKGINIGIVSRGYGRESKDTLIVDSSSQDSTLYGDEPLMIAQKTGIPIAVSSSRFDAGLKLLETHPDIQIIFSDDGLQHYTLHRDIELVIANQNIGFGNKKLLPQGPLREPISRLNQIDALIITGEQNTDNRTFDALLKKIEKPIFRSTISCQGLYSLSSPQNCHQTEELKDKRIAALAGIGNPQKFYDTLKKLNITPKQYFSFPDHYHYNEQDIPRDFDIIITTEKDAVKLKPFNLDNIWVLPISVEIKPNLTDWLLEQLPNI